MNAHKAKGKQFDGIILSTTASSVLRCQAESNSNWRGDVEPYPKSRKILRVCISRARSHLVVLDPLVACLFTPQWA